MLDSEAWRTEDWGGRCIATAYHDENMLPGRPCENRSRCAEIAGGRSTHVDPSFNWDRDDFLHNVW